jgi:putative transcriptional regulator
MGKNSSRVLDAVHETVIDLHKLGFIDKRAMASYNALYIPPVPEYTSEQIKSLRRD